MSYLIDTNIISEVRKGARCDRHVASWYASIDDSQIYLSVLVLGEIRGGIERIRANDPAQARALERWLGAVHESYAERILPVDRTVADIWGRMSAVRPVSTVDALLAATAIAHRMTLATHNVTDIAGLGAEVINPFEPTSRRG